MVSQTGLFHSAYGRTQEMERQKLDPTAGKATLKNKVKSQSMIQTEDQSGNWSPPNHHTQLTAKEHTRATLVQKDAAHGRCCRAGHLWATEPTHKGVF